MNADERGSIQIGFRNGGAGLRQGAGFNGNIDFEITFFLIRVHPRVSAANMI